MGQAGQGRHRHRQRRRPARRRAAAPSSCSGLPTATIDEACAGRHVVLLGARPQGGAAGPVPARSATRSRSIGAARRSSSHRSRRRSRRCAAASLRYRPGEQAALVESLLGERSEARRRRRRDWLVACRDRSSSPSSADRRSPSRPRATEAAIAAIARGPTRRPVPRRRCGAATCTARSTWASRRACCPAGSRSTTAATWFAEQWGSVPPSAGPRRRRHPAAPRPTAASTCSCCSAPTRSPTSPTATSPSGRSPAPRTVIAVDTFLTDVARAGRRRARRRRLRREARHHDQPRGSRQPRSARRSRRRAPPVPTG